MTFLLHRHLEWLNLSSDPTDEKKKKKKKSVIRDWTVFDMLI